MVLLHRKRAVPRSTNGQNSTNSRLFDARGHCKAVVPKRGKAWFTGVIGSKREFPEGGGRAIGNRLVAHPHQPPALRLHALRGECHRPVGVAPNGRPPKCCEATRPRT